MSSVASPVDERALRPESSKAPCCAKCAESERKATPCGCRRPPDRLDPTSPTPIGDLASAPLKLCKEGTCGAEAPVRVPAQSVMCCCTCCKEIRPLHSYLDCRSYLIHLVGIPLWTTVLEPPQTPVQMAEPRYSEEGLEAQLDLLDTLDAPAVPEVSVPEDAVVTCQPKRTLFTRFSFIPVCPSARITIPESDHPVVAPPVTAEARGKGGGQPELCTCDCVHSPAQEKKPNPSPPVVDFGADPGDFEEIVFPLPFPWDHAPPPESTDTGVFAPEDAAPVRSDEHRPPLIYRGPTLSHGEQISSDTSVSEAAQPALVVLPRDLRREPVFERPSVDGYGGPREEVSPPLFDVMLTPTALAEHIHREPVGPRPKSMTPTPIAVEAGPPLHPHGEIAAAIVPPDVAGGIP